LAGDSGSYPGPGGFATWALSPLQKQKSLAGARLFFFYPISSEYQIERINTPNIIEGIRV
jgi:hypothetical protein